MTRTGSILASLTLAASLTFCPEARALEPLLPEAQAAFAGGVHEYLGCEGCHEAGQPDRIPRSIIPGLCGDCHPDPFGDYSASVHWGQGKAHAVCIDCHGIHGITFVTRPDSRAYRSLVCATCHIGPGENFDRSPHRAGMEKTGALACASCHGNHNVQHPTIALVEPACAECHPQDSPPFQMGQTVKARFSSVRDTLALAESAIARAHTLGINARRPRETLREARAGFARARLVWHSLQQDEIETAAQRSIQTAQQALEGVSERLESRRLRRLALGIAWAVILFNVLLLYLKNTKLKMQN